MSTDTDTSASVPNRHRSFTVHHQSVFVTTEHEDEAQDAPDNTETKTIDEAGLLALDDEPFETTLFHHGVGVDTRERASRIETGGSDEFVDDRPLSVIRAQDGEKTVPEDVSNLQGTLFAPGRGYAEDSACREHAEKARRRVYVRDVRAKEGENA